MVRRVWVTQILCWKRYRNSGALCALKIPRDNRMLLFHRRGSRNLLDYRKFLKSLIFTLHKPVQRRPTMLDPKQLDDLTQRLSNLIPQGVKNMQTDIEKNIRTLLQSAFAKMDLVTREEFDVQTAVLERTRAKLEALEKQVAALEQQLTQSQSEKSQ